MMPLALKDQAPVAPPSYQRAQARLGPALPIDALTLMSMLHLLTLCRLAVRVAHRRCPPPLPAGPGGAPRTYDEASLLLIRHFAYVVAFIVSGYARLVEELACFGLGLWSASGQTRTASHSQSNPNSGNDGKRQEPLCMSRSLCSSCSKRSAIGSSEPVISSLTVLPSRAREAARSRCGLRACSRSPSSSSFARLPSAYPHLSWFRLASLLSPLSCQLTRCSFCTTVVGMGCAPLSDPSSRCPFRCSLLGRASHCLDSWVLPHLTCSPIAAFVRKEEIEHLSLPGDSHCHRSLCPYPVLR
jgi:hypothetical protein